MNLRQKYSLKVWLTSVAISFLLSQIPLYYFYHTLYENSYLSLCLKIAVEWLQVLAVLILPWLFVFLSVKRLYKPSWSLQGFKLVMVLVSEFLTLFFLLDSIAIFNTQLLMPTVIMLATFAFSNAVSILLYDLKAIKEELTMECMEME